VLCERDDTGIAWAGRAAQPLVRHGSAPRFTSPALLQQPRRLGGQTHGGPDPPSAFRLPLN